jgi:hypothetical protein
MNRFGLKTSTSRMPLSRNARLGSGPIDVSVAI